MKNLILTTARRFIRPLGSGTTSPILTECEDGRQYALKLPATKARTQLLVNELFASILIREYGLSCVEPALVNVPQVVHGEDALRPDHLTRLRDGRAAFGTIPCAASFFESDTREFGGALEVPVTLEYLLESETVRGAVVFDTWVSNEDARQFLESRSPSGQFDLLLFDNDGTFNRNDWLLHRRCLASTRSSELNARLKALVSSRKVAPFESHIRRLEGSLDQETLREAASFLPRAWLDPANLDKRRPYELDGLLDALNCRRTQVRSMFQEGLL